MTKWIKVRALHSFSVWENYLYNPPGVKRKGDIFEATPRGYELLTCGVTKMVEVVQEKPRRKTKIEPGKENKSEPGKENKSE